MQYIGVSLYITLFAKWVGGPACQGKPIMLQKKDNNVETYDSEAKASKKKRGLVSFFVCVFFYIKRLRPID